MEKQDAFNQSADSTPPISEIAAEMIFGESRQLQLNGGLVAHRPGRAGAVGKYRHLTTHPRHPLYWPSFSQELSKMLYPQGDFP
jgi:hypothetical protein